VEEKHTKVHSKDLLAFPYRVYHVTICFMQILNDGWPHSHWSIYELSQIVNMTGSTQGSASSEKFHQVLYTHSMDRSSGLLVEALNLLYLIVTAQINTRSVMNMFRFYFEHTLHLAIDSLATGWELLVSLQGGEDRILSD
jgi:hypothetical protein